MTRTHPSRNRNLTNVAWPVASLVALLYFLTSLVVVVNSFVWMATFPALWYSLQKVIYWPFQPYWDFTLATFGGQDVPYQTYALASRSPFLVVPVVIWLIALRRTLFNKAKA